MAVILAATLFPSTDEVEPLLSCVLCGDKGVADFILNVILFAPLGIALAHANERFLRVCLAGALLSGAIELAQLYIPGRDSSLGDVLSNTTGAAAGYCFARYAPYLITRRGRAAIWVTIGAAALPVLAVAVTGALLQAALPRAVYYGQRTPRLGNLEWYGGHVRAATLDGLSLPTGQLTNSDSVRELLLAGARIQVSATAGPRTAALAALLRIADDRYREIILIGPDRDDLVFRYRTRSLTLRLDQPDLRVPGALRSIRRNDSLDIAAWRERDGYCLSVNGARTCGLRFTAARGWAALIYWEHLPQGALQLLDAAWLATLLVPLGACAATRRAAWAAVALLVSAGVVPLLVNLGPTPLVGWIGGIGGIAVGAALRSLAVRAPNPSQSV